MTLHYVSPTPCGVSQCRVWLRTVIARTEFFSTFFFFDSLLCYSARSPTQRWLTQLDVLYFAIISVKTKLFAKPFWPINQRPIGEFKSWNNLVTLLLQDISPPPPPHTLLEDFLNPVPPINESLPALYQMMRDCRNCSAPAFSRTVFLLICLTYYKKNYCHGLFFLSFFVIFGTVLYRFDKALL